MAFAIRSSRRVRIERSRNALSKHRRVFLKTVTGGLVAVVGGGLTVATVVTAAGWLLTAVARDRSDLRPVIALTAPSNRLAWTVPAGMASQQAVVAPSLPW